jgi:DNA-binding beta-propeller fold protein YncE
MQKVRVAQNSFQFGEVSDSLVMRTDTAVYPASAQRVENMLVTAEGSLKKRQGLKHIYDYGLNFAYASEAELSVTAPFDMFFKPDGLRVYIPRATRIDRYDLTTAWDISTASFNSFVSVSTQDNIPTDVFFKSDGTKMFICGAQNDSIYEYDLSTEWDITTASYVATKSGVSSPTGLFFKPDGTKLFVTSDTSDTVTEYSLSTAFSLSSITGSQSFSVSSQDILPWGLYFNNSGTKMYIAGNSSDAIYFYSLSTAWDISTASYDNTFISVVAESTSPEGVFFKPDNSYMYVADSSKNKIFQYSLSSYLEQSHLFPFIFDQNEEYVISIEDAKIRCFRLLTDGTVSLVATITADTSAAALPFDRTYLKQYTVAQRGDVMWICHPLFAPRLLTRTSLTTFEISTYTFDQRLDSSVTFQPYSKFQSQGVTLDPSATTGTGITLTTSADYWDTTGTQTAGNYLDSLHVGVIVRYSGNEIEITSVQSATQATGDVVDELSTRLSVLNPLRTDGSTANVEVTMLAHGFAGGESITISNASAVGGINTGNLNGARTVSGIIDENTFTFTAGGSASSAEDGGGYVTISSHSPTADWDEQSFSAKRGYPAAVTFHENRLVYGGTIAEPDALWFSKIGEYFNFDVGEAADADSINLIAATGDVNEIRYLTSNRDLQVFTASSELYVPTYLNQAITPTNAQIRKQTPFGVEFVKPVEVDGATIFCELNGRIIREYLYTDAEDAYSSVAISTIASHLIDTPKYAAVAHSGFGLPDSYAAFTMSNGEMVLFTSNRAERRAAWTRVTTSGTFGSVCAIEDRIFVNVYDSDGNLQLCEFDTEVGLDFWLYGAISSNLVDVSAVYSSGDSVDVIAIKDSTQYSLGAFTVNGSNQVDLSAYSAENYTHAYVGKKYTAKIITNAVDASMGNGPATGTSRGITNIVLDLKNANSVKVNSKKPSMAAGFTGKKEFRSLGYSRDPQVTIEQDDPLTMQVNGIVTELIV